MIRAEAFLAIESTLSDRLSEQLSLLTKDVYSKVEEALSSKDYDLAEQLVQRMSLAELYEKTDAVIKFQTKLAMLFGASRVTHTPGTSVVGLGFEKVMQQQMAEGFRDNFLRAELYLKQKGLNLIAQMRKAEVDEETVHKADRVLQPFASFMDGTGRAFMNMTSSLHTSRVSSYGFTAEAGALGLEEYQINEQLDNRICPVCREMHGKVFKVKDARALLQQVTRTTDPEALKTLQPWPKRDQESLDQLASMSTADIVSRGWHVPPFHPGCRGLLARVGKAPTLEMIDAGQSLPDKYDASIEDFKALGLTATDKTVALWNKHLDVSPTNVISSMLGLPPEDILLAISQGKALKDLGINSFSLKQKYLNVSAYSKAFGSLKEIEQELSFKFKDKSLFLDSVILDTVDQGKSVAKQYMQSLYLLAKDAKMESLELFADDVGGYAWAKYGFSPDVKQWRKLKVGITQKYNEIKASITEEAQQAVEALLSSEDPKSIFDLADLGKDQSGTAIGKALMVGLNWAGKLDFNDQASMARFMSYLANG